MVVPADNSWIPETFRPFWPYLATFIVVCIPLVMLCWKGSGSGHEAGQPSCDRIQPPATTGDVDG